MSKIVKASQLLSFRFLPHFDASLAAVTFVSLSFRTFARKHNLELRRRDIQQFSDTMSVPIFAFFPLICMVIVFSNHVSPNGNFMPKSCASLCGVYRIQFPEDTCQCDSACAVADDCCEDFANFCPEEAKNPDDRETRCLGIVLFVCYYRRLIGWFVCLLVSWLIGVWLVG